MKSLSLSLSLSHTHTHTHTQVQHASDADVRLLAAVTPLLTRKEQLVRALDETNREASAAKTLTPELKQKFAWILVNLEETNKVLQPLMNRFSQRFSKGASESGQPPSTTWSHEQVVLFQDMEVRMPIF